MKTLNGKQLLSLTLAVLIAVPAISCSSKKKDYQVIKEKACYEIKKIRQRMENQSEIPKADWEQLCLALKVYEKLFVGCHGLLPEKYFGL